MDFTAKHRFADMNARKIRQFADLIRGKVADEALELLRFYPNKGARLLEEVLKSAMGNAEDRGARDKDELVVIESRVDGGPIMKRFMPRARGSAFPIKRRYAHIIVTLSDMEEPAPTETPPAQRFASRFAACGLALAEFDPSAKPQAI